MDRGTYTLPSRRYGFEVGRWVGGLVILRRRPFDVHRMRWGTLHVGFGVGSLWVRRRPSARTGWRFGRV